MTDPWDWHIHLHEWLILMVNVTVNIPYMDPMGKGHVHFSGGGIKFIKFFYIPGGFLARFLNHQQ